MSENQSVLIEITCNNVRLQMGTIPKSKLNELKNFVVKANQESEQQSAEKL
jgi:hypothetical protein